MKLPDRISYSIIRRNKDVICTFKDFSFLTKKFFQLSIGKIEVSQSQKGVLASSNLSKIEPNF